MRALWLLLLALCAGPAAAVELSLPANARKTVERDTAPDRYTAPVGVFAEGQVAKISIEGEVRRAAWRLQSPGLTPLQVSRPLRRQLTDAGFDIVLDCAAAQCGGFDFRFATEVLPGPGMYVNMRRYHFLTGVRPANAPPQEIVTILTSASSTSAYVQIIQAGALNEAETPVSTDGDVPATTRPLAESDLAGKLLKDGHFILSDLEFDTGTSDLGTGPFEALGELAALLEQRSSIRVALVGHTDTVGALDSNIALSRLRARSVRQHLIDRYGLSPERLEAEGVGYLAPAVSNLDADGRAANRRVEVIILSED